MYVPESREHEMLRQTLRRFLARECPREKVRRWDEEDYYPPELTAKLRELGIFGLTTPEEYGGAGRDILGAIIMIEELSRGYLMTSLIYIMGAYGYAMEYDVQRYVRDVLLFPIIGGSSAIQRNNIANRLGLAK